MFLVLACAQNQADWLLFTFPPLVLLKPFQIQFHLAFILSLECVYLEIDGHKSAKPPVEKQQIKIVVLVVHADVLLLCKERHVTTQLEYGVPHVGNKSLFKLLFREITVQSEEIQDIRVAERKIGGHLAFVAQRIQIPFYNDFWLLCYRRTLVHHGSNTSLQRTRPPMFHCTHFKIELPFKGI